MFTDLIKGAKKGANYDYDMEKATDEISDERLDEIMAELFGGAGSEDEDKEKKAPAKAKKAMPRADLLRAMNKGADMDEEEEEKEEEEEEEEMEKGMMTRREMMNKVYSMVDDLSDSELDQFLSSRDIKKAQAMAVFHQMSNSDLKDFMSASAANGEGAHEAMGMNKGESYMGKGADMDEAGAMDDVDEFDE